MAKEPREQTRAEKAQALKQQLSALKDETRKEIDSLLAEYNDLVSPEEQLDLIPRSMTAPPERIKRAGRPPGATRKAETAKGPFKYNEALHCKICDVKGHDGRAHKFHPAKFTAEELEAAKPQASEATA